MALSIVYEHLKHGIITDILQSKLFYFCSYNMPFRQIITMSLFFCLTIILEQLYLFLPNQDPPAKCTITDNNIFTQAH